MIRGQAKLVARWHNRRPLEHQYDGTAWRPCLMFNAAGNTQRLPGQQFDGRSISEIDQQTAVNHVEQLVFVIVVMPMKVPFQHANPRDAVINGTERLIEPGGVFTPHLP